MTGDDGSNDDTGWMTRRTALQTVAVGGGATLGLGLGSNRGRAQTAGEERWRSSIDGGFATPSVVDGRLYVPTVEELLALDPADGTVQWTFGTEASDEYLLSAEGDDSTVYVPSTRGVVYALDPSNGRVQWRTGAGVGSTGIGVGPEYVYLPDGGDATAVEAYVPETGDRVWEGEDLGVNTAVCYGDGSVYAANEEGTFQRYDAESGGLRWEARTGIEVRFGAQEATTEAYLLGGTRDGRSSVVARESADGSRRWEAELVDGQPQAIGIAGDVAYAAIESGSLHALDLRTGEERWRFGTEGTPWGEVGVAGDGVYVCTEGGVLHALDTETGEQRWRFDVVGESGADGPAMGPAIGEDTVYAASGSTVFGLVAATPTATPTETATATDASNDGGSGGGSTSDSEQTPAASSGDGPGMGLGAGVLGTLGLGYLLGRRDTEGRE
jgi:outer membrane protein assembly factor BamB